jgi:hypothetical protein
MFPPHVEKKAPRPTQSAEANATFGRRMFPPHVVKKAPRPTQSAEANAIMDSRHPYMQSYKESVIEHFAEPPPGPFLLEVHCARSSIFGERTERPS